MLINILKSIKMVQNGLSVDKGSPSIQM